MKPAPRLSLAVAGLLLPAVATAVEQRYAAVPDLSPGLVPRYLFDRSFPLVKRAGSCGTNQHSCLDVGRGDYCCDDDTYCYINKDGDPKCCQIGSNCVADSDCKSDRYFCSSTVTQSGSTSTQNGCCQRSCPQTSYYLCDKDLGGNCCPYGAQCGKGGNCLATVTESSSSAQLTPIVEGCTTSQYQCPDGKGCCNNNQVCTAVSGTGYCTAGMPTQTGVQYVEDNSNNDLSDGAKAGIAVGTVVGAGLIIGLVTWFCLKKRKERRATATNPRTVSDGQTEDNATVTVTNNNMSQYTPSSRPAVGPGLTQDYFGPDPVVGPYTETDLSPGASPLPSRAVPGSPQGPGDITAPVEIDSRSNGDEDPSSPVSSASIAAIPLESIQGRFELHGSDLPSPNRPPSIVATPTEMKGPILDGDHEPSK